MELVSPPRSGPAPIRRLKTEVSTAEARLPGLCLAPLASRVQLEVAVLAPRTVLRQPLVLQDFAFFQVCDNDAYVHCLTNPTFQTKLVVLDWNASVRQEVPALMLCANQTVRI